MPLSKNTISNPLICKVEFAFLADIASIEYLELHQVRITMQSGKVFAPVYGTPSSYSFAEPVEDTSAGLMYKQKLSLYYPGLNDAEQANLINLERMQAVYLVYYQHGLIQVLGDLNNPARCFTNFGSSEATGFGITIVCNNDERARFLIP